ncbi:MAG: hypothetical protein WDW36_000442 [Sanguina aurantia]
MTRKTLEALGLSHELAVDRVERFRRYDEDVLKKQALVYDDEGRRRSCRCRSGPGRRRRGQRAASAGAAFRARRARQAAEAASPTLAAAADGASRRLPRAIA